MGVNPRHSSVLNRAETPEYSYSRLTAFETCPYGWYLSYVEHREDEGNAFSDYGTLVHSIMERYAKGTLNLWELCEAYKDEFGSVRDFPPNKYADLRKSYYEAGLQYLQNFRGYDDYKVLACERWFSIPMGGFTYRGIIDLLLADKYGHIKLVDYKSKSGFTSKKEQKLYLRQLYTYCMWVYKRYGKPPDVLQFEFIRGVPFTAVFDKVDYRSAIDWIYATVHQIENTWAYPAKPNQWYCSELCGHRSICPERV